MTLLRRISLRLTASPLALIVLAADLTLVWLAYDPNYPEVMAMFLVPAIGAILWIAAMTFMSEARGKRLRQALAAACATNGDAASDDFPDLPVCVGKRRIYCAGDKGLVILPLEAMAWAYVEEFRLHPTWHQLVIWNRDAQAQVLGIRRCFIARALAQLNRAAPWLPTGYSEAMKESWNADHRDFLALVDDCRRTGRCFDVPWAGTAFAQVAAYGRGSWAGGMMNTEGATEEKRLKMLWAENSDRGGG